MKTAFTCSIRSGALMTGVVVILCFLLASDSAAQRRVNLPVEKASVSITGESHIALRVFFMELDPNNPEEPAVSLQKILLEALPESYQTGCTDMIEHWGSLEDNIPGSLVRVVYVHRPEKMGVIQALLAYRCFSHAENYRDNYYDERLMALTITEDKSTLELLPHTWDCMPNLALSKFGVAQVYQLSGDPLVSLEITVSSGNPCCDGPASCHEEKINFYFLSKNGVKQVASIKKHSEERDDSIDDDGEFVTAEIIYEAEITQEENAEGDLSEITSAYSITENGEAREEGWIKYIWNTQTAMFEEVVE